MPTYYRAMNQHDEKLSALLKQWRDIEPKANFEANVLRRIRLAQAPEAERIAGIELWRRLFSQPVLVRAAAVIVAGMIVGATAGVVSAPRPLAQAHSDFGFLSGATLAGGYLKLTSEGGR